MDQLRSLAGSKVADTEPMAEIPLDDAYLEEMRLYHPEQPQIESSDLQADWTYVVPPIRKIWYQSPHQRSPICLLCHNRRCLKCPEQKNPPKVKFQSVIQPEFVVNQSG